MDFDNNQTKIGEVFDIWERQRAVVGCRDGHDSRYTLIEDELNLNMLGMQQAMNVTGVIDEVRRRIYEDPKENN